MNPTYGDAPGPSGTRGVGNIIALSTHPKHSIRISHREQRRRSTREPRDRPIRPGKPNRYGGSA